MVCVGIHTSSKGHGGSSYCHTVLAVVDATAIGQHVDVGAFRTEFAVALQTSVTRQVSTAFLELFPPLVRWYDDAKKASMSDLSTGAYLCEILADAVSCRAQVVAKGAGVASLTSSLSEELAGNMRGICREKQVPKC